MTLRHIRIFIEVIDCGNNISKAAKRMMISQPSVSVAIREMEEEYGVAFFDRFSRRLYLTEAGRQFELYARKIAATCDDMEEEMVSWNTSGIIRVGASITAGSQFMPAYVSAYKEKEPEIRLYVRVDHSRDLEESLMKNELDLAIVENPAHKESLEVIPYKEDRLEIIAPPEDGYLQNERVTLEQLCACPFILRERGSGTREIFDQVMDHLGKSIEPVWETNSTTSIINAVSCGIGISVIPRDMAGEAVAAGKVRAVSVEGLLFPQKFYIVHHRDKLLTSYMQSFIETVRNYEKTVFTNTYL